MGEFKVYTCPDVADWRINSEAVFVAGGISGCSNWQEEFIKKTSDVFHSLNGGFGYRMTLVNPRRDNFDITNPAMSEEQIAWEHAHLRMCGTIVFWFPEETLCPITLFELGGALERDQTVYVGCHPNYKRKFDVQYQLQMQKPTIKVRSSLDELVADLF